MGPISLNTADFIVLSIIICVVALIVRGMLRGSIKTCDSSSCSGSCGTCGSRCANPRIRLSQKQLDELDRLTRQAREA